MTSASNIGKLSRIDFIAAPLYILDSMVHCRALAKVGRRLQFACRALRHGRRWLLSVPVRWHPRAHGVKLVDRRCLDGVSACWAAGWRRAEVVAAL